MWATTPDPNGIDPMGENSITLGEEVGSSRVVPILLPIPFFQSCSTWLLVTRRQTTV